MGKNNCKWSNWQRFNLKEIISSSYSSISEQTVQWKNGQKTKTDISSKIICRWTINIWKDTQRCSLLEKCKSELQWVYYLIPVRMAIKKSTNSKCWRRCGEKGTLLHCCWECKSVQSLWRRVCRFLSKLGITLLYDPAIPVLGIYLEITKIQNDTCTPMFTAAHNSQDMEAT